MPPAPIPYYVKGDKLVHHAFGKETIFHSQQAAHDHAESAGTRPQFVVAPGEDLDNVPEQTYGEANPVKAGEPIDPNRAADPEAIAKKKTKR
jgi:hypothetical protein